MSAERIKPPEVERPFIFTFADEEAIEISSRQYAELAAHFMEVLCKNCEHKEAKA